MVDVESLFGHFEIPQALGGTTNRDQGSFLFVFGRFSNPLGETLDCPWRSVSMLNSIRHGKGIPSYGYAEDRVPGGIAEGPYCGFGPALYVENVLNSGVLAKPQYCYFEVKSRSGGS